MHYLPLVLAVAAVPVLAGFLYQWVGSYYDRLRFARSGRWIDIGNGRKHYLLEKGSGESTVLFEAGIAATNLNWCNIQEGVSRFASTASYDRGGPEWGSPCPSARAPTHIAVGLHTRARG